MSAKRGSTGLSGVLLVDKPAAHTSHDVVSRIRRATGERRVGHAGTLDPMATGLLVVLIGPATRLAPYLTAAQKAYRARVVFGTETDTDDADGKVTETRDVPARLLDRSFAEETVAGLVGSHEQVPPAYSAVKKNGTAAYDLARRGQPIDLEARTVEVTSAMLRDVSSTPDITWDVEFVVSKGTYIRSLARDLGRALSSAAHLGGLRRTRSGSYAIEDAHTIDEIEKAGSEGISRLFADPVLGLGLPAVEVSDEGAARVAVGATVSAEDALTEIPIAEKVAITHGDRLLAVYATDGPSLKAGIVIPNGVHGGIR